MQPSPSAASPASTHSVNHLLPFTPEVREQIISHARETPDREVCGFVMADGRVFPSANIAEDRRNQFLMMPTAWLEAADRGRIAAIYHSHIGEETAALLSPDDIRQSKALDTPYLLFHTDFGKWDYYDPAEIYPWPLIANPYQPSQPEYYLGWPFEYGRSDCYTLVKGYYWGALGIRLGDFPRGTIDETTSAGWHMIMNNFAAQGFRRLEAHETLRDNDVIIMCLTGTEPHHLAVLSDASRSWAIHNLGEGRLSERFVFGGPWMNKVRAIVRHKRFDYDHHQTGGAVGWVIHP